MKFTASAVDELKAAGMNTAVSWRDPMANPDVVLDVVLDAVPLETGTGLPRLVVPSLDPVTGQAVGLPLTGHTGGIWALTAVLGADGSTLLASAGATGEIRLWNPVTGQALGSPLTGHTGRIRALTPLPGANGSTLLAFAGDDGPIRLWNPVTGRSP